MQKIFLSLITVFFISTQSLVAAGYIAIYSLNVSDPASYAKSLDNLMKSEWGTSFPASVSLHQYVFNGYDDATHAVVLDYENAADLGKGVESFSDPVFQAHLSESSSMLEDVEQSLNMKLISGGTPGEDWENGVYTTYRMQVKNPSSYAKEYSKFLEQLDEAGNLNGSYGLRQNVAGDVNYYSHYAFTSAGSMAEAMEAAETLYSSKEFAEFSEKVAGNRELISISILSNIVTYN